MPFASHGTATAVHRLFTGFFLIGILGALGQLLTGDLEAPARVVAALWEAADLAVEVSLGLIGVLALWSGLFRLAEESRLADRLAGAVLPFEGGAVGIDQRGQETLLATMEWQRMGR